MKRLCVPALLLVFCFAISVRAQESRVPKSQGVPPPESGPSHSKLTPLQMLELRGDIQMAKKQYSDAILIYRQLLKEKPKDAAALNKLGIAYEAWGNNGKAEHFFKKAVKADKVYASAYNNVGTVEYARKHYRNAIQWYLKALNVRPGMAAVYCNLGYAYFSDKNYQYAMTSFHDAFQIDPRVMQENGDNGTVVQERGVGNPGEFYYLIARTYAQAGDAQRAAIYLKIARDDGYEKYQSAKTDPAFARVIKDPRVQAVFQPVPEMAAEPH